MPLIFRHGPAATAFTAAVAAWLVFELVMRARRSWAGVWSSPGGRLDDLIVPLVTARAPGLLSLHGVGPDTAALLLVAAGDHPERLRSEAAWAHLCGAAPIPASSGKVRRHRLNPGGNREANHALWRIVITRMSSHPLPAPTSSGAPKKA
jgi:transposase